MRSYLSWISSNQSCFVGWLVDFLSQRTRSWEIISFHMRQSDMNKFLSNNAVVTFIVFQILENSCIPDFENQSIICAQNVYLRFYMSNKVPAIPNIDLYQQLTRVTFEDSPFFFLKYTVLPGSFHFKKCSSTFFC